jgi:beta-lactamase regulating signal transducer with metallopeptidase domain
METISHWIVSFVVNSAWQGVIIVVAAFVGALALRRAPARYQHLLWVAALLLIATVPFLTIGRQPAVTRGEIISASESYVEDNPQTSTSGAMPFLGQLAMTRQRHLHVALPLTMFLAICYAALVLYRGARLFVVWRAAKKIRIGAFSREMPGPLARVSGQCHSAFGLTGVPILFSGSVKAPLTLGVVRPVIILPLTLLETESPEILLTIIGHEMAHIKRRDFPFNIAYELLSLLVAFHPATILIRRYIAQSRELACDEMVTDRLLSAPVYARALLEVAGRMAAAKSPAYSLGVFDAGNLEGRIMRLTETKRRAGPRAARVGLAAGILFLAIAGLAASGHSLSVGAVALSAGVSNRQTSNRGGFPAGSYRGDITREVTIKGVKTSVKDHILVFFTTDGQVVVALKEEGKNHPSKTELGSYRVDGDEFVITESEEQLVEGVCAEPGRYKWYYDGKILVFTKVKDECEGRALALTSGPLSPFSQEK